MNTPVLHLSALHESGRIYFTYLNGYSCDSMELSDVSSGSGSSKLNAEQDLPIVQGVLSGNTLSIMPDNRDRGIEVAKKLMPVYCAGSCTVAFYQNGNAIPADLHISGADLRKIELIQKFLKTAVPSHSDDYPSQVVNYVFKQLTSADIWKAVEGLAAKALKSDKNSLSRFYIEDALMSFGIKIQRPVTKPGFALGLQEDNEPRKKTSDIPTGFDFKLESTLDILLEDFLLKIKSDWKEGEVQAAGEYVKSIFKKYGYFFK